MLREKVHGQDTRLTIIGLPADRQLWWCGILSSS
jgi:hypothetical protein